MQSSTLNLRSKDDQVVPAKCLGMSTSFIAHGGCVTINDLGRDSQGGTAAALLSLMQRLVVDKTRN